VGISGLTDDELWLWHAYDYGFREVVLHDKALQSPIDPYGEWHDPHMVMNAARFYRGDFR
jgi:hypothetical protein